MQITDYDLLVLRAFEALKREISEAEQYTVNHYNTIVQQQQDEAKKKELKKEQVAVQKETKSK